MVGRDPPGAGERELGPEPEAGPVDRDHDRLGEALHPADKLLPRPAERLALVRGRERDELIDVGARDEVVLLPRDQHDPAHGRVGSEPFEHRLELPNGARAKAVHGFAGYVERDHGDTVGRRGAGY
jgi:hypothetical protein